MEIYTKKKLTIKHFGHAINTFISLKQRKLRIDNERLKYKNTVWFLNVLLLIALVKPQRGNLIDASWTAA